MSLFKGQNSVTQSKKIDSFQATVCEFGLGVPLLYGRCRTSLNLINYQDFKSTKHEVTTKSGKSKSTSISYYYNCYLELAIGEQIASLGKIWVGDKKYDNLSKFNGNAKIGDGTRKNTGSKIHIGCPLQVNLGDNPSPTTYMSTKHADIAIGYDGLSYLYGYVYLGEDTASVPSYKIEVNGNLQDNGDGIDANPANIIKDILQRLGLGDYIDEISFDNYVNYCHSADLLVSTPDGKFNNQTKAQEIIAELLELTNTYMYWNTDRFVFMPRDDRQQGDWHPNKQIVYDLSAGDLSLSGGGIVNFKRKDSRELYNHITVKFTNRANDYETESITYQDVNDIRQNGIKTKSVDALWLHTKERAVKYAKALARKYLTEQNQYTLKLDWKYARLTPADLIRVTDTNLGLDGQVMMVSEVQEDKNGLLTITAIQRPAGSYSEAQYTITDNYSYQDFNIEPSDTSAPLFIIPPADLITSSNGLEIWIALHGETDAWGGCNVFVSDKDGEYSLSGTQDASSSYGKIVGNISATDTIVNVQFSNPDTVELLTGSPYDAEQGNSLIWINGECLSYSLATLTGVNAYTLSGLKRGQYGTTAASHVTGESIAVLDSNIYVLPLTKHYQGRTLYFKFPSFNVFGSNGQDETDLDYYTCVANTADLPNCTNVTAYNKFREAGAMVVSHDIIVDWQAPQISSYRQAQVWYKSASDTSWKFAGQGYNSATIPQATLGETYTIAVCTEDIFGNVESPDMSAQVTLRVEMKNATPNTPTGLKVSFGNSAELSWNDVTNADIRRYEVRIDDASSTSVPLLTTNDTICYPSLQNRQDTIYLRALSVYGEYSSAAVLAYSKAAPTQPNIPNVTTNIGGLNILFDEIPNDCKSITVFINNESFTLTQRSFNYNCEAGIYKVKYCFNDYFGAGAYSAEKTVEVAAYIKPELIGAETFNTEKMSQEAINAIGGASAPIINVAVAGMLGEGSALVLDEGKYSLVAANGEKLTGLFANDDGTMRLQGDYIHITGDTVFDENVIIKGQMVAGSISCDDGVSINAGAISVTKDGMVIDQGGDGYTRFDANGITFTDANGKDYTNIGRCLIGQCPDGKYVRFNNSWVTAPSVLIMPQRVPISLQGYNEQDIELRCAATKVSENGFFANIGMWLNSGTQSNENTVTFNNCIGTFSTTKNGTTVVKTQTIRLDIPQADTQIHLTCGGKYTSAWNGRLYAKINLRFTLLVNGETADVGTTASATTESTKSATVELQADFEAGSTVELKCEVRHVWFYAGGQSFKVYDAYAKYSGTVGNDYKIGSGIGTFIAMQTDERYTFTINENGAIFDEDRFDESIYN